MSLLKVARHSAKFTASR